MAIELQAGTPDARELAIAILEEPFPNEWFDVRTIRERLIDLLDRR